MQNNQGLGGQFCTVQGTIFLPPIWKKVYVQPYKIIYQGRVVQSWVKITQG